VEWLFFCRLGAHFEAKIRSLGQELYTTEAEGSRILQPPCASQKQRHHNSTKQYQYQGFNAQLCNIITQNALFRPILMSYNEQELVRDCARFTKKLRSFIYFF